MKELVLLHLHEIMERVYFNFSMCVCVSVCQWTNFQPNGCTKLDAVFAKFFLTGLARNLLKFGNLWLKVKVTVTQYPFFLHDSLWTSLLWISALLFSIKMKFDMPLRYAIGGFAFEFHKYRMSDYVIATLFKFSPNNC